MHVERTASSVRVQTPAKLNLYLEVLEKRDDGFHEIETLMAPVSLYDTLWFESRPAGDINLAFDGFPEARRMLAPGIEGLPEGSDNIVVRAVRMLREQAGVGFGAALRLVKRIPLAAGMGGGSSDAAAALAAANEAWRLRWPAARLRELAAALGSDVPFFLGRGPAICRGRGELIEPVRGLGRLHFVVAAPPVGLSTADVFQRCRPAGPSSRLGPLIDALAKGDAGRIASGLHNRLQAAAEQLSPWIPRLGTEFSRLDFIAHQMSGSGTSYFGVCRNARHARRCRAQLESTGVGRVYAVQLCC